MELAQAWPWLAASIGLIALLAGLIETLPRDEE